LVKSYVRGLVLLISVSAVVLLGGAGSSIASTQTQCNAPLPTGRQFCVTVVDSDGVSPSGLVGTDTRHDEVTAYQFYKFTIQNVAGTSTLTNGAMSVVLNDNFPGSPPTTANSTALFVPSGSSPSCAAVSTSPNRVDCNLGNLAAGASTPTIVLAYRTSKSPNVISTTATTTVSFKEGSNPNGANPSSLTFDEITSLEPDPESSVSWSPPGQNVQMGTSPIFDSQFSTLQYTVPNGKSAFTATMNESSGTLCGFDLTCFGEVVTTDLSAADPNTFTATNLFHLVITMDAGLLPTGNTKSVVVVHQPDTGPAEEISLRCPSSTDPPSSTDTLPCIQVNLVTVGKGQDKVTLLVIGVWGFKNGGWVPGV
jgi:hypothetical protein